MTLCAAAVEYRLARVGGLFTSSHGCGGKRGKKNRREDCGGIRHGGHQFVIEPSGRV
jgi:hypothetical protein